MKISVFGLGYVGAVSSACFARDGFEVVGVDVHPEKVERVGAGKAPIIELGLGELLADAVRKGRLTTTTSARDAVAATQLSMISVGTPSRTDGAVDLAYVYKVCEEIGDAIAAKASPHVVVIRSTVAPGTTKRCTEILQQHAGGTPVHVAFNPEFLREGAAIRDFDAPPYTIIGTADPIAEKAVRELYAGVNAPVLVIPAEQAELIKASANAWHATKISFANEIGRLAKAHGVDGRAVMDLLVQDTKLNISPAYLKPGFAFGGSCLPKDVRALIAQGRDAGASLPLLESLLTSNDRHIDHAEALVLQQGKTRIGVLGLAFKAGTDDLRESPALELVRRLLDRGLAVRVLDDAVREATLIGSNRRFVEEHLPQLPSLLVGNESELLEHAELVVVTQGAARFRQWLDESAPHLPVVDLGGLYAATPPERNYDGIGW